jgi:hypothetical protein
LIEAKHAEPVKQVFPEIPEFLESPIITAEPIK